MLKKKKNTNKSLKKFTFPSQIQMPRAWKSEAEASGIESQILQHSQTGIIWLHETLVQRN